jgi:hypothetical protein
MVNGEWLMVNWGCYGKTGGDEGIFCFFPIRWLIPNDNMRIIEGDLINEHK